MASSSKDIQLRELKDTISQLKTMMTEQTELFKTIRLVIDEKYDKERRLQEQNKLLQEQIDYLTKKLFGTSSEKKPLDVPGQLEDGRCSFTNNLSENAIRPFTVGRKNWLFSSSVDGANASAVVYTMVEMAKAMT